MKSEIRQIGNSKGIIVPKAILEQCHLENEIDMEVKNGALIIRPHFHGRQGWLEAFSQIRKEDETAELKDWQAIGNSDEGEWEW